MINIKLTNLYKDILRKNNLVDSGKLSQSIKIDSLLKDNILYINIMSLDYLKYLVTPNQLTKQFVSNQLFIDETQNLFYNMIEKSVDDILNGKPISIKEPEIIIKYNGK
jgi:hypothetical protein